MRKAGWMAKLKPDSISWWIKKTLFFFVCVCPYRPPKNEMPSAIQTLEPLKDHQILLKEVVLDSLYIVNKFLPIIIFLAEYLSIFSKASEF